MKKLFLYGCAVALSLCSMASQATTLRILTVFSPGAQTYYPTASQRNAYVAMIHGDFNAVITNSGIGGVNVVSAGTTVSNNSQYDVDVNSAPTILSTDPDVLLERDVVGADVTVIVVSANQFVRGSSLVFNATARTAFAAIQWDSTSFYTLAHEVGHLVGLRHQRTGGINNDSGPSTPLNAHGLTYGYDASNPNYDIGCASDVMGTESTDPNCNANNWRRSPIYSNPNLSFVPSPYRGYISPRPSGQPTSYAANGFATNAYAVSQFHNTMISGVPISPGTLAYERTMRVVSTFFVNLLGL